MERRYSRADFYNGKFYQLGKELFKGTYKEMSNNERVIYAVLKNRFDLSIANGWVDENNDIFFYFDQNQLAEECCISSKTVQRSLKILNEYTLIESIRQGINLPNRLYLLKPELQIVEKKDTANTDKKRIGQKVLSGCDKMTCPDRSKSPTNYTEKKDTEYISSSMADATFSDKDQEEEITYEYISSNGIVENITCVDDIAKYIDIKTDIESNDLSTQLCKRMKGVLLQIFNPFDLEIKQFRVEGKIIELDADMRKKLYRLVSPKLFCELVGTVQNNPEPIKSLRAFVLACLYNHASFNIGNRGRAAPKSNYNDMMQRDYEITELERELLHN